jgi:hypothetical protein
MGDKRFSVVFDRDSIIEEILEFCRRRCRTSAGQRSKKNGIAGIVFASRVICETAVPATNV